MDWSTDEDEINTDRKINPKLIKYSVNDLIANMPNQFRRLNLCSGQHSAFLAATCEEPMRIMSYHNKISTSNDWGHKKDPNDKKSTPFEILNVGECRRIMLQIASDSLNTEQKERLMQAKMKHLKDCKTCFRTFREGLNKLIIATNIEREVSVYC